MAPTKKIIRTVKSTPQGKHEGFAVGVSQSHYWIITALAMSKKTNRMHELETIIDHYIHTVLAK